MTNTSASGGYLAPSTSDAVEGDPLDDIIQDLVKGITGLTGSLVRPRWQPNPPPEPPVATNWCAIGVTRELPESNASTRHWADRPDGVGHDELVEHSVLEITASFYGPGARNLSAIFRNGLRVSQNREKLFLAHMGFVDVDPPLHVPDLLNQVWRDHVDQPFRLRRAMTRTYPVENLLEATGQIHSDRGGSDTPLTPFDSANARDK